MALREFERRLERLVEGVVSKAFRSRLSPLEVARRITRTMDVTRTVGVRGVMAANRFRVLVGSNDHAAFVDMAKTLQADWAAYAQEHAREEGYVLVGPIEVTLVEAETDGLTTGQFRVEGELAEGAFGGPPASLTLPDGGRVQIGDEPVLIGRSPDCDIHLVATEVSRQHAEIRRQQDGIVVVDLDSLNGTKVNGVGIAGTRVLDDGDKILLGNTVTLQVEIS